MPITLNGDSGITTPTYGGTDTSEYIVPVTAFKNRIINGAMQIDQRNAGASVTVNDAESYVLDRYFAQDATDGVFTVQQSSIAPAGFTNSMLITVTTADSSLAAGQLARIAQRIEGFNVADLAWGTASASTITLSFWVRSSLTGTFGGSLTNAAFNRSYPFSYTISAANTWEQKSITIAGDTTGTWLTTNGVGLVLNIGLGVGSTLSGTAGAWSGSGFVSATGATSVVGTSGATFYLTGVQLEKGSTATSFDYRPYGTELALCQRYYQKYTGLSGVAYAVGQAYTSGAALYSFIPVVQMRAAPTLTHLNVGTWSSNGTGLSLTSFNVSGSSSVLRLDVTVSSGLTAGNATGLNSLLADGFIAFSAEL
jgi:hypothetical protein